MSVLYPTLPNVAREHATDLRNCAAHVRAHGLTATASEMQKAAGELEAAAARAEAGEPSQRELDMAMMIRRLCSHTANAGTREQAMGLLRKHGLQGSPLR